MVLDCIKIWKVQYGNVISLPCPSKKHDFILSVSQLNQTDMYNQSEPEQGCLAPLRQDEWENTKCEGKTNTCKQCWRSTQPCLLTWSLLFLHWAFCLSFQIDHSGWQTSVRSTYNCKIVCQTVQQREVFFRHAVFHITTVWRNVKMCLLLKPILKESNTPLK